MNNEIKLEKTKVSTMLHEFKMEHFGKHTEEYKYITDLVNKIDRTSAKDTYRITSLYEDFLNVYITNGMGGNKIALCGRRMDEIVLFINSKVQHNYYNGKIESWKSFNAL